MFYMVAILCKLSLGCTIFDYGKEMTWSRASLSAFCSYILEWRFFFFNLLLLFALCLNVICVCLSAAFAGHCRYGADLAKQLTASLLSILTSCGTVQISFSSRTPEKVLINNNFTHNFFLIFLLWWLIFCSFNPQILPSGIKSNCQRTCR